MPRRLRLIRLSGVLLALLLPAACSPAPPDALSPEVGATPPGSRGGGSAPGAGGASPPQSADLTPLPTPQAVLSQVPIGRAYPFAPLQGSPVATARSLAPSGFRLRGEIGRAHV